MAIISAQSGLNGILLSVQRILAISLALGWLEFYSMPDEYLQWLAWALAASVLLYLPLILNPMLRMLINTASVLTLVGTVMAGGHLMAVNEWGNANPQTFPLAGDQWLWYALLLVCSMAVEVFLSSLYKNYFQPRQLNQKPID